MKIVIVYRDQSDHARSIIDFMRDYERQTGRQLATLEPDTPEGAQFCSTYDIVEYPSIVAVSDDGILQHLWRGLPLPLINEVSYYDHTE